MLPYVDEISYIGRKGNRRPIKIELTSKRLRKYILENYQYFKNAGFGVSEYLSDKLLQERKELKAALQNARRNGHHAVIKNNKLLINGKESFVGLEKYKSNYTEAESKISTSQTQNQNEITLNSTMNGSISGTRPFRN